MTTPSHPAALAMPVLGLGTFRLKGQTVIRPALERARLGS